MLRLLTIVLLGGLTLSACGYQMDKYQGMTNRDDIENMGANDELTAQTENPRLLTNVGDTWGLKQDRKLIKEAATEIPGIEVKRIILEASQVWITVDIKGENDLSEQEIKDWKNEISQAVYRAVPRYNIHVRIS